VPREALFRGKVGFRVPVGEWFKKPLRSLVADLLLSSQAAARGYFNPRSMEKFVREHFEGIRDRQKELWALVNFELWCRHAP
jgi:asparagine synthase (glutamine-hydrolysing)